MCTNPFLEVRERSEPVVNIASCLSTGLHSSLRPDVPLASDPVIKTPGSVLLTQHHSTFIAQHSASSHHGSVVPVAGPEAGRLRFETIKIISASCKQLADELNITECSVLLAITVSRWHSLWIMEDYDRLHRSIRGGAAAGGGVDNTLL